MFKVSKQAAKPQWVKYKGDESVELLINPLSLYYFQKLPTDNLELTSEQFGELICKLIVDFKGIYDDDDKEMKCTEENKLLIADHAQPIAIFVIDTSRALKEKIVTGEKLSKN